MNRRMKKKVEKRNAEALRELSAQKVQKVEKPAPKKEKKVSAEKPAVKTASKPAEKKEKPAEKVVKATVSGDVQLLVSKKVHLYVEEKGKAACGAAQGADTEIRGGAADEVTCKLCQRSLNK